MNPQSLAEKRLPARRLTAILAGALMVAAPAVAATPANAEARTSTIDWQQCKDTQEKVECATVKVPLDWSKPNGQTIEIGLARRKAAKPGARIGSILFNAGGPGISAVEQFKGKRKWVTQDLYDRFDVIGVDPRGLNTSTQIKCDSDLVKKAAAARAVAYRSQADFSALRRANVKLSDNCRKLTGPLYDHVDSRNVARDTEAIRVALGEDKITQIGFSYGTLTIQAYAELFSNRVRALVGDGNMDHSVTSIWDFMDVQVGAVETNFNAFADWCDKTSDCAFYGQDTRKSYGELKEKAKSGDLVDPSTGDKVDFVKLTSISQNVNLPTFWKDIAATLKHLLDGTKPEETPPPVPTQAPSPKVQNYVSQTVFCQDWDFDLKSQAEVKSLSARLARKYPNMEWNPNATESLLTCVGYQGKTTNPQAPAKAKGTPPLVLVGNLHDFATVYPWSQAAAKQMGANLVTYEGYAHTYYPGTIGFGPSKCMNDAIDGYLIDLKVPAKGLSCPALEVPGGGNKPE
ncbi:alpha/beta hydrolase [Microtetraspora malaysiensis]|uniref:alpha/beta hydrolase n=1 Tax=Microtetraspora malaysiensis TaxID=161358 RepID=UPI003D8EA23A